ncbi:MAG: hypothetical protein L0L87_11605, partial [Tetragenococcus koreensis]|nr:hypothetical protein [Tetragenococcus koreensis]MDN6853117.1 hypothetical protein [Tetragenococcus koreensis]
MEKTVQRTEQKVTVDKQTKEEAARKYTDTLVEKALKAEQEFASFTQEQVDKIVNAAALAGSEAALELAHEAV